MVSKEAGAFLTIGEAAASLGLPQHILRYWESRFTHLRPLKKPGGRRYYRPEDIDLLRGIRALLYREHFTIKGAQRVFSQQGKYYVASLDPVSGSSDEEAVGGIDGSHRHELPRPVLKTDAELGSRSSSSAISSSQPSLSPSSSEPSLSPSSSEPSPSPAGVAMTEGTDARVAKLLRIADDIKSLRSRHREFFTKDEKASG